jgi:hypothetical protein
VQPLCTFAFLSLPRVRPSDLSICCTVQSEGRDRLTSLSMCEGARANRCHCTRYHILFAFYSLHFSPGTPGGWMSGAAHGSSLPTLALCARSLKAPEFNPPFEPPASFAFSWESPSSSFGADFVSARSKSPRPGLRTNGRMVAVRSTRTSNSEQCSRSYWSIRNTGAMTKSTPRQSSAYRSGTERAPQLMDPRTFTV